MDKPYVVSVDKEREILNLLNGMPRNDGGWTTHVISTQLHMSLRDAGQWVEYHKFWVKKKKLTDLLMRKPDGTTVPT